jgi:hypothetical protein
LISPRASNESEPGFFLADTIAHAGPTLPRSCIFTINATCLHTGWVFTRSLENNDAAAVVELLDWSLDEVQGIPFWVNAIELEQCRRSRSTRRSGDGPEKLDIHFSPVLKNHQPGPASRSVPPSASRPRVRRHPSV